MDNYVVATNIWAIGMAITNGSVPHFDLPFRFGVIDGSVQAAFQEQDTIDDLANCVEMAIFYRQGERDLVPTFGITDPVFKVQPLDVQGMTAQIERHEPRVNILMTQNPDWYDALIAHIRANVSARRPGV